MIGRLRRLRVKTLSACQPFLSCPVTPYLGVRTNSLGLRLMAPQIASITALALFRLTPMPSAIRNGKYCSDFHPALRPNNSCWAKTKNVLAEHVARTNRLALKSHWAQIAFLNGP